jgi:hypothetical protein
MSSSVAKRIRKPSPYVCGRDTPFQPGDEVVGDYSRERLIRMDGRFRERLERAFRDGTEHRESAATNGANALRLR